MFVELHNVQEINVGVFKEKIDAATEAYNISDEYAKHLVI